MSDTLDTEDAIAMEVDMQQPQDTLTDGGSRPATSQASPISPSDDEGEEEISQPEHPSDKDDGQGAHGFRPASLPAPGASLTASYQWISPKPTAVGPYAVGVDEAGRGPALGPLVYGMAFCPVAFVDGSLAEMGFDDSKTLTHETRVELLKALSEDTTNMGWAVSVISPQAVSSGMLRRPPVNLNTQSQNATIALLQSLLSEPYALDISEVYVDALGPAEKYQAYLQSRFRTLKITVRNKADSLYKIVGAASVAAKVTRDYLVEGWVWEEATRTGSNATRNEIDGEATWGKGTELGSGYPSDPNTKAWIAEHLDKTFGFPTIARFSWAPIRTAIERDGHKVQWYACNVTIQSSQLTCRHRIDEGQKTLIKSFESVSGIDKGRSMVTKELGLSSVSTL